MLLYLDGTALYSTSAQALAVGKATALATITGRQAGAFTGSYSFSFTFSGTGSFYDRTVTATGNTTILGFRMTCSAWTTGRDIAGFQPSRSGGSGVTLTMNGSPGVLQVVNNTTVLASPTFTTSNNVWDYYELKVVSGSGSTGRVVLRVNGVTLYDSGATLAITANFPLVTLGSAFYYVQGYGLCNYSDIYVCDGSGSQNNDFLGDVRVETLLPTADGAHAGFTVPFTNLLTANQASLETGAATGWVAGTGITMTVTTTAHLGTYGLDLLDSNVVANNYTTTTAGTGGIAVTAGTVYTACAYSRSSTNWAATVGIQWYDSSGAVISTGTSTFGGISGGGWFPTYFVGTAPAGAAYAAVVLHDEQSSIHQSYDQIGLYQGNIGSYFWRAPGDTTHFGAVSEAPYDSDQTYLTTATVSTEDTYVMADLNSTAGTPVAVLATSLVRKETATPRTVSNVVRVSSTDYVGSAFTLNNDLAYHGGTTVWETNPNTSTAWTISNVNALEAGIQLSS